MPPTTIESTPVGTELAAYETAHEGRRVLVGARVDGDPHVYDCPAEGASGRRYLVERGLRTNDELQALLADYLAKAKRLGYAPMHGWF
jgi:hypothetical protein